MSTLDRLRAVLAEASDDWRPVLAAQLLAEALSRARLLDQVDPRVWQAVNLHLHRAADDLDRATGPRTLEVGDTVIVQAADGQRQGAIAALFATTLFLHGDDTAHMRRAVIRNLTKRPDAPDTETRPCA